MLIQPTQRILFQRHRLSLTGHVTLYLAPPSDGTPTWTFHRLSDDYYTQNAKSQVKSLDVIGWIQQDVRFSSVHWETKVTTISISEKEPLATFDVVYSCKGIIIHPHFLSQTCFTFFLQWNIKEGILKTVSAVFVHATTLNPIDFH